MCSWCFERENQTNEYVVFWDITIIWAWVLQRKEANDTQDSI
jgi:hypothetical protein